MASHRVAGAVERLAITSIMSGISHEGRHAIPAAVETTLRGSESGVVSHTGKLDDEPVKPPDPTKPRISGARIFRPAVRTNSMRPITSASWPGADGADVAWNMRDYSTIIIDITPEASAYADDRGVSKMVVDVALKYISMFGTQGFEVSDPEESNLFSGNLGKETNFSPLPEEQSDIITMKGYQPINMSYRGRVIVRNNSSVHVATQIYNSTYNYNASKHIVPAGYASAGLVAKGGLSFSTTAVDSSDPPVAIELDAAHLGTLAQEFVWNAMCRVAPGAIGVFNVRSHLKGKYNSSLQLYQIDTSYYDIMRLA